ncbi:MAG: lipopolysaccharide export system permease protein [Flavobacteriales bacterium]|jgi:lipopolysaccharide export system permease protein
MSKIKSYIASIVWFSILGVLFVILALDFISDFVEQLSNLRGDYTLIEAVIYVFLYIPSSLYDFLPLSALVGCLIGLGILANTSELTVIRAAGVSVSQIVWAVFRPVLVYIIFGALLGEYVAPYTDQFADSRRDFAQGHKRALQSDNGLWHREGNTYMHFNAVLPNGKLYGMTRYKFDDNDRLLSATFVESAIHQGSYWFEQDGRITHFEGDSIRTESFTSRRWDPELSPDELNVLVLDPEELPMKRLYDHAVYLDKQSLDSSEYRLAFWQKALQPLATLSLVIIAISFVLGPLRQVTMGFRVFVGVLVGLVFQTSLKMLGPTSIILGFPPVFAVLTPILVCFIIGWALMRRAQ